MECNRVCKTKTTKFKCKWFFSVEILMKKYSTASNMKPNVVAALMLVIFSVGALISYFTFQHAYSMPQNTTVQQDEIQSQTESKSEYVTMFI